MLKKVFIVVGEIEYETRVNLGAFMNMNKAEAFLKEYKANVGYDYFEDNFRYDYYHIEELEVV